MTARLKGKKETIKARPKQLVEIVWLDPTDSEGGAEILQKVSEDSKSSLNQYLAKTTCYGAIYAQDTDATILSYCEEASGLIRFSAVSRHLVQKVIPYYRDDRVDLVDAYERNLPAKKKRQLVEVAWLSSNVNELNVENIGNLFDSSLKKLLAENFSYGVVFAEDADVLLLKYFENEFGERKIQAIPRSLIQRITPFYQSGRTNSVVQNTREASDSEKGDSELAVSDEDISESVELVLGEE